MSASPNFLRVASAVLVLVGAPALSGMAPVGAQDISPASSSVEPLTLSEVFPDPEYISSDVIAALNIDPGSLGLNELIDVRIGLGDAQSRLADAMARYAKSSAGVASGIIAEAAASATQSQAQADADEAERDLKAFAVGAFSGSELANLENEVLGGKLTPQRTLQAAAEDRVLHIKVVADTDLEEADNHLVATRLDLSNERHSQTIATADLTLADSQIENAHNRIAIIGPKAERTLGRAKDPKLGFSVSALDAYYNAELVMAEADPGCGVEWWQLAGIGRVESIHATHGGAKLYLSGNTTRKIRGPALDGEEFLAIPDSDGGKLDGDLEWDRAVGPMQFIPGSWRIFGADGNSDGYKNPNNVYDATVAAGRHLCGSVRNITDGGRFRRALLDYNRSTEYGATVQRFAKNYREDLDLVRPSNPAPEQEPVCMPESDQVQTLPLMGCGAVGRSAGVS